MPVWLRTFTYGEIGDFYKEQNEKSNTDNKHLSIFASSFLVIITVLILCIKKTNKTFAKIGFN